MGSVMNKERKDGTGLYGRGTYTIEIRQLRSKHYRHTMGPVTHLMLCK